MNEAELESMVVELGGDSTNFTKMMEDAAKNIDDLGKKVTEGGKAVEGMKNPLIELGNTANKTFGEMQKLATDVISTFMSMKAISWVKGGMDSAIQGEQLMVKLKYSIKGTEEQVTATMAKYEDFAKTIASITTASKGEVLEHLKQAETMGLTGEKAMWATKALIGMNDAMGDGTVSMRMMASLAEGIMPPRLERYFPELKRITNETEKLAKAQQLVSEKFKVSQALLDTTGGQIEKLEQDWKGLRKEFGTILMEAMKPLVELQREIVGWFKGMSKEAKTAVVTAVGLGIAFIALSSAIAIAGVVFNTYFGGIGIIIGAIVTGVTALILTFGGVGDTMKGIKKGAEDAWAWLKPVRQELSHLWDTMVEIGTTAWNWIKDVAVTTWKLIVEKAQWMITAIKIALAMIAGPIFGPILYLLFKDFNFTFENIRNAVVDAMITAEYAMKNMADTWELVWAGMKYYTILALNTILKNIFLILAGPILLPIWLAMQVNWKALWDSVVGYAAKSFKYMLELFRDFPQKLEQLMKGALSIGDILKDWAGDIKLDWKGITVQGLDDLEKQLEQEFEQQKGKYKGGLDEFKKKRKAEMEKEKEQAKKDGGGLGDNLTKGMVEKIKGLDAVLIGSLAAFDRYIEYRNKLEGKTSVTIGGVDKDAVVVGGGVGGGVVGGGDTTGKSSNSGASTTDSTVSLLTQIRDILQLMSNKPKVTLGGANI